MTRNLEPKIKLDKEDITIMYSIARQVFKGTALTDRQFALMQKKLSKYKDQFEESCDFDSVVVELRKPLRQIDRSKYIKIVDTEIKIRFPFRKTEVVLIEEMKDGDGYRHDKGSHEHYFAYTELNVLNLLDRFLSKEFDIDQELLDVYKEIKDIASKKEEFLPGIYNKKLKNINPKLEKIIQDELGSIDDFNYIKLLDRKLRYGLHEVDVINPYTLTEKVACRNGVTYHSKPSKESLDQIMSALQNLDRYPLLVVLDSADPENQLYEMVNYFRDIISYEEQSVLFRVDDKNAGFNQLVHDRKLNNWVDKTTKVVYISNSKIPKLIVNGDWKATTAFCYNSMMDRSINNYIHFNCDLQVFREEETSPFRRYSRLYG
jgi:hypothetical protein